MSIRYIIPLMKVTIMELLRMKVFGVLTLFSLLLMLTPCLPLPHFGAMADVDAELRLCQSTAMGALTLFAVVFAMTSTAVLLPKDMEDRVVYTILYKPISRLDYLVGKCLGVLSVITLSLLLMSGLMFCVLSTKAPLTAQILPLLGGVLALWGKSCVIVSLTLCLSTISSSTLFALIITTLTYFIGHYVGAFGHVANVEGGTLQGIQYALLIFPDFSLYNVMDALLVGEVIPLTVLLKLAVITGIYCGIYLILAWLAFARKEF